MGAVAKFKRLENVRSVNSQFTKDIKSILEGKTPNPYREQTLLSKAIKEGYIACKCSNKTSPTIKCEKTHP